MSVTGELWTCPHCEVTEQLAGPHDSLDEQRRLVQLGHRERHEAEATKTTSISVAFVEALDRIAAFRVRLVVAPGDLERVRAMVVRRSLPIEVFADPAVQPGGAYVMQPRRGVRELSTTGDNPGDDGDAPVTPR